MIKITEESYPYKGYLKVKQAIVEHEFKNGTKNVYSRFKLDRPDAVAILIYNRDTNNFILTKQFRYPIFDRESNFVIEIVAGKIDGDEAPKEAASREILEEVGYRINPKTLEDPIEIYPSPGYTNEKIYIFFAIVTDSDKDKNHGGGLDTENEEIEIVEMPAENFMQAIISNEIKDAKTILSASLFAEFTFQK